MAAKTEERKSSQEGHTEELEVVKMTEKDGHYNVVEKGENGQDIYEENGVHHKVSLCLERVTFLLIHEHR